MLDVRVTLIVLPAAALGVAGLVFLVSASARGAFTRNRTLTFAAAYLAGTLLAAGVLIVVGSLAQQRMLASSLVPFSALSLSSSGAGETDRRDPIAASRQIVARCKQQTSILYVLHCRPLQTLQEPTA